MKIEGISHKKADGNENKNAPSEMIRFYCGILVF